MPKYVTSKEHKEFLAEQRRTLEALTCPEEDRLRQARDAALFILHRDGLDEWEVCFSKGTNRAGDCDAQRKQLRLSKGFFISRHNRAIKVALIELVRQAKIAEGHTEAMQRIAPFARAYVSGSLGYGWTFEFAPSRGFKGVDIVSCWDAGVKRICIQSAWAEDQSYEELRREVMGLVRWARDRKAEVGACG